MRKYYLNYFADDFNNKSVGLFSLFDKSVESVRAVKVCEICETQKIKYYKNYNYFNPNRLMAASAVNFRRIFATHSVEHNL